MTRRDLFTILLTTFLSMAVLYAPQPLFPVLASRFGVSQTAIASLITWSLVPMAVVPLFAGVLMQGTAPRRILAACALLLGVSELAFALSGMFWTAAGIRFVQGALVSTLLAATMTYVSLSADRVPRVMAMYVAASVLGGLVGRLAAGYGAAWIGMSSVFLGIGGLMIGSAVLAGWLAPEPARPRQRIDFSRMGDVLRRPSMGLLYGVVFTAFLVFTALLNFVPFRVSDLGVQSTGASSLTYIGFLLGLAASLFAHRVTAVLGSRLRAMAAGLVVLGAALLLAWIDALPALIASICSASAGFFLVHAVLSGYVNQHAGDDASLVNGLYVAIYYAGGTVGSFMPGLIYATAGWTAFLGGLALVASVSLMLLWLASRVTVPQQAAVGETR